MSGPYPPEQAGAGAAPQDPLPRVIASQIGWLHSLVFAEIGRHVMAKEAPDAVAEAVLELLDLIEGLLSEPVLHYAVREG